MLLFLLSAFLPATPARAGIDGTIEQVIPISTAGPTWSATWSATSTTYSPTDNSMGLARWDATKYNGTITVYFEAVFASSSATAGSATVGLFASGNTTTPVATVTSPASTAMTRVRSAAVTLTSGTDYTIRTKVSSGVTISLREARLIVVQSSNWPTPITATETQIELGDDFSTTSTTYTIPTDERFWTLPAISGKYDASPTCYFEGTLKSSVGTLTTTLALVGAAGNGAPLATVTTIATAFTRVRSSAFTCPTSAQDVHPELKISGSGTASMVNARVIIDQNGAGLSKLETYLALQSATATTTATTFQTGLPFLWEPGNYSASPAPDLTATAAYSGVAYKVSAASASAQVCQTSGCGTNTPLAGSLQGTLNSTTLAWGKTAGAVTMPAASSDLNPQYRMNAAGTLTLNQNYLPLDLVFNGSLQLLQAPSTSALPAVTLSGGSQSTGGALGLIRVKDNRPGAPGWTLTASSTDFTSGLNTITAPNASIAPGSVTTPNGSNLTGLAAGAGGTLDVTRTLTSATSGNGLGTYDVNPTETVQIATGVKTGTYTSTLTITLS